jgi:hypothetical protein
VLRYSDFKLCLIICSEFVHKSLDKEQRSGKNGGCASDWTLCCSKFWLCLCNSGSARNLCVGSFNDLAWKYFGKEAENFSCWTFLNQWVWSRRKYAEISLIFFPAKILFLYARKHVVYSNNWNTLHLITISDCKSLYSHHLRSFFSVEFVSSGVEIVLLTFKNRASYI